MKAVGRKQAIVDEESDMSEPPPEELLGSDATPPSDSEDENDSPPTSDFETTEHDESFYRVSSLVSLRKSPNHKFLSDYSDSSFHIPVKKEVTSENAEDLYFPRSSTPGFLGLVSVSSRPTRTRTTSILKVDDNDSDDEYRDILEITTPGNDIIVDMEPRRQSQASNQEIDVNLRLPSSDHIYDIDDGVLSVASPTTANRLSILKVDDNSSDGKDGHVGDRKGEAVSRDPEHSGEQRRFFEKTKDYSVSSPFYANKSQYASQISKACGITQDPDVIDAGQSSLHNQSGVTSLSPCDDHGVARTGLQSVENDAAHIQTSPALAMVKKKPIHRIRSSIHRLNVDEEQKSESQVEELSTPATVNVTNESDTIHFMGTEATEVATALLARAVVIGSFLDNAVESMSISLIGVAPREASNECRATQLVVTLPSQRDLSFALKPSYSNESLLHDVMLSIDSSNDAKLILKNQKMCGVFMFSSGRDLRLFCQSLPPGVLQTDSNIKGEGSSSKGLRTRYASRASPAAMETVQEIARHQHQSRGFVNVKSSALSLLRVRLLCSWVNTLHLQTHPLTAAGMPEDMCSGLLLARLMQALVPGAVMTGLNHKARSKRAALNNIEQALGVIWRSKTLHVLRIPSANDILLGNNKKICMLLNELFNTYVMGPARRHIRRMLLWYDKILRQYDLQVPNHRHLGSIPERELWIFFQSAVPIFCVLYHLCGSVVLVGEDGEPLNVDPSVVTAHPSCFVEYQRNVEYVFTILRALDIPVLWEVNDWLTQADGDFLLLQLFVLYEALNGRRCSIPPATGASTGVTSGPDGEPKVVGLVFREAAHSEAISDSQSASLPLSGTLPLLSEHAMHLPASLVSVVDFAGSPPHLQETSAISPGQRSRPEWNASSLPPALEERLRGDRVSDVLRGRLSISGERRSPVFVPYRSARRSVSDSVEPTSLLSLISSDARLDALTRDMQARQRDLADREADLSQRFADLEALVDELSSEDYEVSLSKLENVYFDLDRERTLWKQHYARLLSQPEIIPDNYLHY